jgi:hypothetical protein
MFLQFRLGEDVQPFKHRRILGGIGVSVETEKEEKVNDDHLGDSASHTASPSRSVSPGPSCSSAPFDVPQATARDGLISREISPAQSENDPAKVMPRHWQLQPRFPCSIEGCERRLTTQHLLRIHMEAHKPKPKALFPCRLGCSKKYSRNHDRLRHEVEKHGKVCKFKCESCGKSMWRKKALEKHECPVAPGATRCVWMDA